MRSRAGGVVGVLVWVMSAAGCAFDPAGAHGGASGGDDGDDGDDGVAGSDAGGGGGGADAGLEPGASFDAAPASGAIDAAPEPPPPEPPPPGPPPIQLPAACDLVTQEGCAPGLGCHLFADGAFCSPAGDGAEGNLCWDASGCRRGLDCVDPGTGIGGICAQLCWDSSVCESLTGSCQGFGPPIYVGADARELGVCL